jgi:hypothetical protein
MGEAIVIKSHDYSDSESNSQSTSGDFTNISDVFEFTGIEVTAKPRTLYKPGEVFDPTNMIVTAYIGGQEYKVKNYIYYPNDYLIEGDTEITISYTFGKVTQTCSLPIIVKEHYILGVTWDGTSTTKWTRTDDAVDFGDPEPYVLGATRYCSPFDDIMPWSGMIRVSDEAAGELVAIPKFWYKWTKEDGSTVVSLQIANYAEDGFYTSPAHVARGDGYGERDIVYVGRFHCNSDYRSAFTTEPITGYKYETRVKIHALGETIWQYDATMWLTIRLLYLVEFADWNSRAVLGCGGHNTVSDESIYNIPYHTGTTQTSREIYGEVIYRNIADLYNRGFNVLEGAYAYGGHTVNIAIIINPNEFDDTNNGTTIGTIPYGTNVHATAISINLVNGIQWVLPSALGGSNTTYISDIGDYVGQAYILSGADTISRNSTFYYGSGMFSIGSNPVTNIWPCRLMVLPNTEKVEEDSNDVVA